ncbi:mechanosensitive ion channel family protein [Paracoccus suum]|uniref:Mechanosensitive ion channel family protein n=1 Tax=Paracoccus suum TaxID=2259340 RepID=A0A344PH43_9RHOB|nr:mechanosensitive ion channel domain-containing protein [Paracoccus suum]AXC48698.1 mechanosensitive ion channel family protein [Paracoccus suum]
MEHVNPDMVDAAQGLWAQIKPIVQNMLLPWRLWQLLAILCVGAVAQLSRNLLAPRLNRWLRGRHGWPKWRLRIGILIQRKLRVILFALLAWALVIIMRNVTWPSRSHLIALAAAISSAWVAIEFLVRLIANKFLRRIIRWGAWVWVTLYFLNLSNPTAKFLDSLAIGLGDFRLSALTVIKAVVITGLLIAAARVLSRLTSASLAKNTDVSPTMRVLIAKIMQAVLLFLAIVVGLAATGIDLTGLTIFSGALGVGLGFGLQKIVSNLMSGVIILLDKSIKPGDVISIGDTFGWIDALGARYVSVVTRDGKEYLIPNEELVTGQVVNWSHTNDFVRLDIEFRASYRDDPHEVSRIAINASMTVKRVLAQRTPVCWVTAFGESGVHYMLRFWISDPQAGLTNVRGQVYLALWDAFRKRGITLPLAQTEIRLLGGAAAGAAMPGEPLATPPGEAGPSAAGSQPLKDA